MNRTVHSSVRFGLRLFSGQIESNRTPLRSEPTRTEMMMTLTEPNRTELVRFGSVQPIGLHLLGFFGGLFTLVWACWVFFGLFT
ncbi:hypothetical protein Taro_008390 [Colocasia esculenta]|uniref:Uncharacterized protein n=1 Tax=Colocasia esculenta TaxID=4460 RepID=A0A843TX05_COLES|nr:hypothetical protein [Colocasia esculenta]